MRINDIIERIKLPFRKEKELFSALRDIIGFYPHNIEYYKTALTHKSSGKRNDKGRPLHNERLEFLGDALLDAVVGHIVFEHFKGKREGFLTNTRSKLVSRESLGKLAQEMGLTELIQSNGAQRSHNSYMAGNAFEALVGAIYLDQGYDAVMRFMKKRILKEMVNIDKVAYKEVNFKSKLLEWTQKNRVRMEFRCTGQDKDEKGSPVFGFVIVIEGVDGGEGKGYSKKEAQQLAAKETLQRLRREPQFIDAIFQSKSNRTKMEEEPMATPPDLEADKTNFIIDSASRKEEGSRGYVGTEVRGCEDSSPKKEDNTPKKEKGGKRKEDNSSKSSRSEERGVRSEDSSSKKEDEFDLSDITHNTPEPSREDIIAAAEAAAFSE